MASAEDRKEQQENSDTPEDQTPVTRQRKPSGDSAGRPQHSDFMNCLTDEAISLDDLQKLKLAFEGFEMGGLRSTDVKNFGRILKNCLDLPNTSDAQIQGLFKKIDYSGRGRISWGELCAYMLQEYKERQDTVRRRKQVDFTLPATMTALDHGFPIVNIRTGHNGTVVSVREDGLVCHWSPELQPLNTKDIFTEGPSNRKSKWASDFALMTEHDKLIIGTGDREIQFYELSSLEPYCQITTLETVPLTLDYSATGCDKCCILYGDTEGCVTIILFSFVGDTLRLWNKLPRIENVPSIAMDSVVLSPDVTFVRWKIHQDWVTQAKYFAGCQAVVSSSRDESSSLVIGCVLPLTDTEQRLTEIREAVYKAKAKKVQLSWTPQLRAPCDQRVFTVHKGVKTFDLCRQHSLLVTGGLDRLVRLWNPIFPGKPTGLLKGHSAPIAYLSISSEDSRIFSVSTDGAAKIWDIQDQCCLFTAEPKASGISGDIAACSYSAALKSLYVAADSMTALSLKTRPRIRSGLTVSHNEPVMCCGFSEEFRQVVSCCEGSIIKIWDIDTGRLIFEFGGTHDLSVITCMAFDPAGRRLVTGEKGGCLKIWNFNNGQCLKTLRRGGEGNEVCDCIFFKVHRNSYVMSVGHDRKIDIYSDIPEDFHHVQRPQPSWQDDVRHGHKEDILCVAHCPPALLATGSYDGEIIVWNVVSGCIVCRFISPPPEEERRTGGGNDSGVSSIVFLKECRFQQFSLSTALVTSGAKGCINLWSVLGGGKLVVSFKAPCSREKITKLARTQETALLYAADQTGFIYAYDIESLAPEQRSPKAENVWRAHNSRITGLQIVDNDQAVLTSSTDRTLRLWSARGELIGTFGQSESWSLPVPSSWRHPAVPCEDTSDLSCTRHGGTPSLNTNLPNGAAAGDTGASAGELKAATDGLPLPSECDEDAEEGQAPES